MKRLALAALLFAAPVYAGDASPQQPTFARCQMNATTFSQVVFNNNQGNAAQQECNRLLNIVNDNNATCNVVNGRQNGKNVKVAQLILKNLVNANTLQNALQQLAALIQNNSLLSDQNLLLQLDNNGQCQ